MLSRYTLNKDQHGWSIVDMFTGMVVVLQDAPMRSLEKIDAQALLVFLNSDAFREDRRLYQ